MCWSLQREKFEQSDYDSRFATEDEPPNQTKSRARPAENRALVQTIYKNIVLPGLDKINLCLDGAGRNFENAVFIFRILVRIHEVGEALPLRPEGAAG